MSDHPTIKSPTPVDRARGALLGLAAGDAVGTTLEFRPPGTFDRSVRTHRRNDGTAASRDRMRVRGVGGPPPSTGAT